MTGGVGRKGGEDRNTFCLNRYRPQGVRVEQLRRKQGECYTSRRNFQEQMRVELWGIKLKGNFL